MDVVLIHSGVTDSREWAEVTPLLEQAGHRVVAPDLPGYGSAPLEPGEHSLAEVVLGSFEGKAALVGTSFGGRAVLEAAFAAPERIETLALVNANHFGWSDEVERLGEEEEALFDAGRFDEAAELMVRGWLVGPNRKPEQVAESLRARVHAMQMRAYELQANVEASLQRTETLPLETIQAPTLVVRGALDWPDVERAAQRFLAEIPNAREVVIDGVAHLPAIEQPDRVAEEINWFLADAVSR